MRFAAASGTTGASTTYCFEVGWSSLDKTAAAVMDSGPASCAATLARMAAGMSGGSA